MLADTNNIIMYMFRFQMQQHKMAWTNKRHALGSIFRPVELLLGKEIFEITAKLWKEKRS